MDLGLYNKKEGNQAVLIGNWVQDRAMRELYKADGLPVPTSTQRITSHSGAPEGLQTTTAQDSFQPFTAYDPVDIKQRVQMRDFGPPPTKGEVMSSTIMLGDMPVPKVTSMQSSFMPLTVDEQEASRRKVHARNMRHQPPGFDRVTAAAARYNC